MSIVFFLFLFSTLNLIKALMTNIRPVSLILGSSSPIRQQLLRTTGIAFDVAAANIDERSIGNRLSDPETLVGRLSQTKADKIIQELNLSSPPSSNTLLLTADQVVTNTGIIMEKPVNADEARRFVESYSSNSCTTVGCLQLTRISTLQTMSVIDKATVHFKYIPPTVIDELISDANVMNCAGALMIEHPLLEKYIDRIDGDPQSVMGLSTKLLNSMLMNMQQN